MGNSFRADGRWKYWWGLFVSACDTYWPGPRLYTLTHSSFWATKTKHHHLNTNMMIISKQSAASEQKTSPPKCCRRTKIDLLTHCVVWIPAAPTFLPSFNTWIYQLHYFISNYHISHRITGNLDKGIAFNWWCWLSNCGTPVGNFGPDVGLRLLYVETYSLSPCALSNHTGSSSSALILCLCGLLAGFDSPDIF